MDDILVAQFSLGGSGPRVAVKDSIDIAGYPTRAGSRIFAEAPPASRHAAVVAALLDAGCRIIGKANMHELAYGVTGINRWTGTAVNPRHPALIPGGSSSGSAAAVAAGLADFSLGTDTGGSIRVPAACCGVYGLKPTFGRISRMGVMPGHSSLDCVGPFAPDLSGIERAMSIIDPGFRPQPRPNSLRLGVVAVDASPQVEDAIARILVASGCAIRPAPLAGLPEAYDAGLAIIAAESWAAFGAHAHSPLLGDDVGRRLRAAAGVSPAQRVAAEQTRAIFTAAVDAALNDVDALVLPTLPDTPPSLAAATDDRAVIGLTALVRPFNLSGHPALSLPLTTSAGLPAGLQLVGRKGADAELCAIARCLVAAG